MAYEGPRFRRDLVSTVFHEGGIRYVDVHDPKRSATFRLFDYEYSVALAFDGRDLGKVISWVRLSTGLELNQEQLTEFARRLDQLGFLEKPEPQTPSAPPAIIPGETPLPVHVPCAPATPRDQATPAPEAGSLATATRPSSSERLARTGAAESASEPAAAPEPEPPASVEPSSVREEAPAPPAPAPEDEVTPATLPVEPAPAPAPAPPQDPAHDLPTPAVEARSPYPLATDLPVPVGPSPERPRPAQRSARLPAEARDHAPRPSARPPVTPPPIPKDALTPTPLPSLKVRRVSWVISALFGILAAFVIGAVVVPFVLGTRPPAPVSVVVVQAKPTDVVRWIDEVTASIEAPPLQTQSFPLGGKVLRMASPGLELRPGDVVAATDNARWALADWARAQEQRAFARQLLEGLRDSGDEKKLAAAQATLAQREAQVERTRIAAGKVAVLAKEPSTVDQTMASLGQTVKAGDPAVRLRLPGWRIRFDKKRLPMALIRKQGLCLVEIAGRPVECSFVPDEADEPYLVVSLPAEAVSSAGQLTHLARSRVRNAYVLPLEALSESNGKPRLLLVAPDGRVEMRSVVLADRTTTEIVVVQGLDTGDTVVVQAALPVGAGTPVRIVESLAH